MDNKGGRDKERRQGEGQGGGGKEWDTRRERWKKGGRYGRRERGKEESRDEKRQRNGRTE